MDELAQDKLDLISKIIKNDKKFSGNEDLYDDFFNETCKRSFIIVKNVKSEATLSTYVKRIASTAILNVLKDNGRLRRTKKGYIPTKEVPFDISTVSLQDYADFEVNYPEVHLENSPEDIVIKKEILNLVKKNLLKINENEPEKQYLKLFMLRYENGMTQKEISQELNLSQSEVCKRLFRLMEKIKKAFND